MHFGFHEICFQKGLKWEQRYSILTIFAIYPQLKWFFILFIYLYFLPYTHNIYKYLNIDAEYVCHSKRHNWLTWWFLTMTASLWFWISQAWPMGLIRNRCTGQRLYYHRLSMNSQLKLFLCTRICLSKIRKPS